MLAQWKALHEMALPPAVQQESTPEVFSFIPQHRYVYQRGSIAVFVKLVWHFALIEMILVQVVLVATVSSNATSE